MKNTIFVMLAVSMSLFAFGQKTPASTPLEQAIEEQVLQQTNPSDATRVSPRIVPNASDSRIVHMNGKTYQLRKKERTPGNGQFDTHTYVSPTDTMTVNLSRANFEIKRPNSQDADVPAGFTVTSREQLQNDPNHQSQIVACERRNANGTCDYIVKKTDRHVQFVPANADGSVQRAEITKGTITVRQTHPAGANTDSLRAGAYQAIRNTNIQQTFGPNVNRGGPNDVYGPESYPYTR